MEKTSNEYRSCIEQAIYDTPSKNYLIELPTGFGKTRIALNLIDILKPSKILVVIPTLLLIKNWKDEIIKWKKDITKFEFTTYKSLEKHSGKWDMVIFDECHHMTENCLDTISEIFNIEHSVMLSATVPKDVKDNINRVLPSRDFRVSLQKAISENVLPDPKVKALQLVLDNTKVNCLIVKNKSKGNPITVEYKDRFKYSKIKNRRIEIKCTQKEYYDNLSNMISYMERLFITNPSNTFFKNRTFLLKGERLKWLSRQKTDIVKSILQKCDKFRTLTFCADIAHTEELGKYHINSKNKNSDEVLKAFNEGKINHITACKSLNEGANLVNCSIGIFAYLSSSSIIIVQRIGRLLRVKNPMIIIPYYKDTRDEEIVAKMTTNFKDFDIIDYKI